MPRATQLTVCLDNRPGQVARLAAALKKAKVNILAISVADSTDIGVVRLVVDKSAPARRALARVGLKPTPRAVVVVNLPNEPGALEALTSKLAAAGVNIDYVYGSVTKGGPDGTIVLGVDDVAKALRAV
jgi:hypothetical protein